MQNILMPSNRRQHVPNAPVTATQDDMDRMFNTTGSFKITFTESGGSVSTSFQRQDAQRPGSRLHNARPAISPPPAPAVQQLHIQPAMTSRLTTTVTATPAPVLCKFFAKGFCKWGASCLYSHGVLQHAPKAAAVAQLPVALDAILLNAAAAGHGSQHHQR